MKIDFSMNLGNSLSIAQPTAPRFPTNFNPTSFNPTSFNSPGFNPTGFGGGNATQGLGNVSITLNFSNANGNGVFTAPRPTPMQTGNDYFSRQSMGQNYNPVQTSFFKNASVLAFLMANEMSRGNGMGLGGMGLGGTGGMGGMGLGLGGMGGLYGGYDLLSQFLSQSFGDDGMGDYGSAMGLSAMGLMNPSLYGGMGGMGLGLLGGYDPSNPLGLNFQAMSEFERGFLAGKGQLGGAPSAPAADQPALSLALNVPAGSEVKVSINADGVPAPVAPGCSAATDLKLTAADIGKEIGNTGFTLMALDARGITVSDGTNTFRMDKENGGTARVITDRDKDGQLDAFVPGKGDVSELKDDGDPHRYGKTTTGGNTLTASASVDTGGSTANVSASLTNQPKTIESRYDFNKDNTIAFNNGSLLGEKVTEMDANKVNYLKETFLSSGRAGKDTLNVKNLNGNGDLAFVAGKSLYDFSRPSVFEKDGFADKTGSITKA